MRLSEAIPSMAGLRERFNGSAWIVWMLFAFQLVQFALLVQVREAVVELRTTVRLEREAKR